MAASKIHQHLAALGVGVGGCVRVEVVGVEGGMAAMASQPGSRWPQADGAGRGHFISKQVLHQAFQGLSHKQRKIQINCFSKYVYIISLSTEKFPPLSGKHVTL